MGSCIHWDEMYNELKKSTTIGETNMLVCTRVPS